MRTFSLVEGTSDKFWHIDVAGTTVTVHYGRTGTAGQRTTKEFATPAKADEHATKQIAGKVAKGYVEGASSDAAIEPTAVKPPRPAAATAETSASPSPAPQTPQPSQAPQPPPSVEEIAAPIDFGDEGLGLLIPALARRAIAGELPPGAVTPERTRGPFSAADETAWAAEHGVECADWWHLIAFNDLPFESVPEDDLARAAWWDWWGQGRGDNRFGNLEAMAPKSRATHATKQSKAEPGGSSAPFGELDDTDPFSVVAARLALADADRTLRAASDTTPELYPIFRFIPALRAMVVEHLSPAALTELETPPSSVTTQRSRRDRQPTLRADLVRWALLGESEKLVAGLRATPLDHAHMLVALLFAVPDVRTRLELLAQIDHLRHPHAARHALWLVGAEALPLIRAGLDYEYTDKQGAQGLIHVLAGALHGPAAVDLMVDLALDSKDRGRARDWLLSHPEAITAWAAGGGAPSAKARDLLAGVVREVRVTRPETYSLDSPGFLGELVRAAEAEAGLPVLGSDAPLPDWWTEALAAEAAAEIPASKIKVPAALPSFAQPAALPRVLLSDARLDDAMTEAMLRSAAHGIGDPDLKARPLVAAVRDRLTPKVRDAVATALLDGFLASGANSKDRALFMAAGFLGHDGFALHLAPLVREWPGQSQHQRAVLGLDVLAATGTDTALGVISGIANKSKFKGVQKAARESLEKLAVLQGLSVHQLEDRVVPDGGLDVRGHRAFDYGARSFRVELTPAGKLSVRDLDADGKPTGKPRTALPAANSKDDADRVATAKAEFTVLRKQVTDLAKVQTARLEQAMVSGRTWTGAEHEEFLARHPILNSLIRPLVWSVTDAAGGRTLVRVTEEHDYLTITDDTHEMPADAVVTLAHRLTLSDEEATAWRQHLVDYDLTSPVEQLERAVFGLPEGQQGRQLAGLPTGVINPLSLVGGLEKLGWRRGNPADAGVVSFLSLTFESLGLAAVLSISDGLWTGMLGESGDQRFEELLVGPAEQVRNLWYVDSRHERDGTWLDWTDVDPLVVSETRRSIAALEEKMT